MIRVCFFIRKFQVSFLQTWTIFFKYNLELTMLSTSGSSTWIFVFLLAYGVPHLFVQLQAIILHTTFLKLQLSEFFLLELDLNINCVYITAFFSRGGLFASILRSCSNSLTQKFCNVSVIYLMCSSRNLGLNHHVARSESTLLSVLCSRR